MFEGYFLNFVKKNTFICSPFVKELSNTEIFYSYCPKLKVLGTAMLVNMYPPCCSIRLDSVG